MKKQILPLLATVGALTLTSCFQSETVIHLKKDGSGTIVEETSFGEQMKTMMAQMSALGGEGADKGKDPMAEMFSEEKGKKKAAALGEGVTFDKVEKVKLGDRDGYRVTYKFADINKVKFDPGDATESMKPPGADGEEEEDKAKKSDPITFTYASGNLTIHMPKPDPKAKKEGDDSKEEEEDPQAAQQEAMMKQMFADMKISVRLTADDGIAKTDATYNSGGTITLMEMDFGKLMKDPTAFKKLQKANPQTPEEIEATLKGVEGIKMESKPEVTATLK
ncbi:hypothetical protein KBB96_17225 [Luteolibacter ambystomatis]|uniref:Lipoprotein n=1 Tax=Luteolibacter ambystomatis TaxID=2824561 RepID=A0A975G777_9BACT|nr:hypothetical protein [Luteolibacter ambystomatis]QUE50592.1 hypothetical protein KBB96_17225 [Luteolibacter ambystomatis]